MVTFPNCKINLGLKVLGKREDGFHDLETIFYPVKHTDALEIITATREHGYTSTSFMVKFTQSGLKIGGKEEDNICIKAYNLLKQHFELPPVEMHLHKVIPMGAGLGGGSADGAFTLKLLNEKYTLNLSKAELIDFAVQLGSDCPFFIINKPCFARSRGEIMEEISLDLSAYDLVLVNPSIHINTGWAFSKINKEHVKNHESESMSVSELINQPLEKWKNVLNNNFENPIFQTHPEIKIIKEELYNHGAIYASMSGSGSTVFGFFKKGSTPSFDFPEKYSIISSYLLSFVFCYLKYIS